MVRKHEEAVKQWRLATEYLGSVSEGIPLEVITKWRSEEAAWLAKVVDIKNHKTLDNPYVAPKDGRELQSQAELANTNDTLSVITKVATSQALKAADGVAADSGLTMQLVSAIEGMIDLERERCVFGLSNVSRTHTGSIQF